MFLKSITSFIKIILTTIMDSPKKAKYRDLTVIKKQTIIEKIFTIMAIILVIVFPLAVVCCIRVVKQYKRAVVMRFGRVRLDSPAGPGIIWVIPFTDTIVTIDLRTQSFNVPRQEILTKDLVTVTVDAIIYFHVFKPLNCLLNVQSHKHATELLAVSTLWNVLGQYKLKDLLASRDVVGYVVRKEIDKATADWGVRVERVEIKDVVLSPELQKAMAAEAEGTRLAKAKVIEAEGEIKVAEHLKEASRIMLQNPQTMLLRYMQTLNFITSNQNATIIYPFPVGIPTLSIEGTELPNHMNL